MTHYEALNKRYKEQDPRKAFAHFPYSPASGENWETHYEKLAKMAKHEDWNFKRPEFKIKYEGQNYSILADYLNYTFLRVQELDLIVYSEDGDKVHKPEALTTYGRSEVQKYKLHDNRYIQPAGGSQLTPAESGQGHRLMNYYKEFKEINASLLILSYHLMKPIFRTLAFLICTIPLTTCSDEFLTKVPQGDYFENFFYNEKGIDNLLTGTYAMVRGSALWEVSWGASIQNWTYGSVSSDDAYKGSENTDSSPAVEIELWEVQPFNSYPADKWRWAFGMGISRANEVLNVIRKTEDLADGKRSAFNAEVRFLRALFYFEAWLVFGDYIPLIDEDTKHPEYVSNINPSGAVLAFIVNDLRYAWEYLPESQVQPGRPTKYAAMALAARAYLEELDYSNARPLLDNIITSGKYSLMPNFFDNFRIEKENNSESIFEIQANVNDINESLNAEMGIGLNWPHGGDIGMCCGFHQPSQNLANAFKVDPDGLPLFDTFNDTDLKNDMGIESEEEFFPATDLLDPRIDWTLSRRGIPFLDWGINRGNDWIRSQAEGGPYLPAMKPFFYKSQRYTLSTTTGWMSGINANNYRYLRYSHVLLWRAEVAAFEGDLEKARELVNMIRERAGHEVVMGKVLVHMLPKSVYPWGEGSTDSDYLTGGSVDWSQPAANYKVGLHNPFANSDEAMRAVQWEQRLEFATEGRRFFDLRRWDRLPGKIGGKSMEEILNSFAEADLRVRSFMRNAHFSNDDKYMPVPQDQIDMQPGVLKQRPEYIPKEP